jgi:fibronectin-binding autotransporter adhesin
VSDDGASVTLSGAVTGNGGITKSGSGQLTLSAPNTFRGITTVNGGRLTLADSDSFGDATSDRENLVLQSGTLQYSGSTASQVRGFTLAADTPTNAVILDVQDNLILSGQPWANAGALIKRGPGVFELSVSGTANKLSVGNGMAFNNTVQNTDLIFPDNGDSPTDGYTGFTVAEGIFRVTGTADSVTRIENVATIGARTTQGTVSPALEIDGGTVYLGGGSMHSYIGAYTAAGSVMTNPALRVTGGATLHANSLHFGYGASTPVSPEFLVDDANADIYWTVELANQSSGTSFTTIRNGGVLSTTANDIIAHNRFNLLIEGGTVTVLNPSSRFSFYGNAGGTIELTNNGRLAVPKINMESSQGVTLAFDNGTYQPTIDGMLIFRNDDKHTVDIRSGGAVFEVNAGVTYTVARPLTGIGGVTKTGTGTLIYSETLQDNGATSNKTDLIAGNYEGPTLVSAGTLIVSNSTIRTDAQVTVSAGATLDLSDSNVMLDTLAGNGTVNSGTLSANTISPGMSADDIGALTVDSLAFNSDSFICDLTQEEDGNVTTNDTITVTGTLTGAGLVDFGRTSIDAMTLPCTVDIMYYNPVNGTPVVSGWKVHNTGVNASSGEFTAVDGIISVTVGYGGTVLMIQ